jgi:ribosomal protein L7/L12
MCRKCGAQFPNEAAEFDEGRHPQDEATDAADEEILGPLRAGRKIEAIKIYRETRSVGLAEAKKAVEAMAAEHGITPRNSGCTVVVGAVVVLGGWLAAYLC